MAPFNAIGKAPGVYIEEVQVAGPIAGVSTSTAAFIGPAAAGPMNKPVFLSNWTQFIQNFGVEIEKGKFDPYISVPTRVYVTHAIRGFFDNGGSSCYFIRVGTARRAFAELMDRTGGDQIPPESKPTLVVTAKQEGVVGHTITVEVGNASITTNITAKKATATVDSASNKQATVRSSQEAEGFCPGDIVFLKQDDKEDRVTIASIRNETITFLQTISNSYNGGTIRIADLKKEEQKTIRVSNTAGIEPGSYVQITQGTTTESVVVQSVDRSNNFIYLQKALSNDYSMNDGAGSVTLQTLEFKLIVRKLVPGSSEIVTETFDKLAMDSRHSRYFLSIVGESELVDITLAYPPSPALPPNNLPRAEQKSLLNGQDDDLTQLTGAIYAAAIQELERVDDINILCIPDRCDQEVQQAMVVHCERMQDRFAILDPQPGATSDPNQAAGSISQQIDQVRSDGGYAALYYPRIYIADPTVSGQRILVPPSGHLAGIYARTDSTRGVFKAPANEAIRGVLDLEGNLTDGEQGALNELGVNVLRSFPGRGPVVWGARTVAPKEKNQWRYINIRRLLLYIEESIQEGTRFAVFEPNTRSLWKTVKRQVDGFLTGVWRDGGLFGSTPDEAFRVRVDDELNPPENVANGLLTIEVIVRPAVPAEFIVFRIIQDTTGASLQE